MTSPLFNSLTLGSGLTLKNRIAKASMSEHLADANGNPGEPLERLYERFSQGGAALLLSGNVMVDREFIEGAGNVVLDEKSDKKAFERYAKAGQSGGSAFVLQISHPGRQTPLFVHTQPLAPSSVKAVKIAMAFAPPKALTEAQINKILEKYSNTAKLAQETGFDGVQLHGAHGYLISQFLSPKTNLRKDGWGGELQDRSRFLMEAIRRVRAVCGKRFTLGVKLNVNDLFYGLNRQGELSQLGQWMAEEGVDFIEVSGGDYENPLLYGMGQEPGGRAYFLEEAMTLTKACGLPIMLTGGLRNVSAMESAVQSGAAALVGLARPLALDPDWPNKAAKGQVQLAAADAPNFPVEQLKILSETSWFGEQLGRMSRGLEPKLDLDPWTPLASYLVEGIGKGLVWQFRNRLVG